MRHCAAHDDAVSARPLQGPNGFDVVMEELFACRAPELFKRAVLTANDNALLASA
jgi:hypothetical protein